MTMEKTLPTIDSGLITSRRLYQPSLFVNRAEQLRIVDEKVRWAQRDKTRIIPEPIINYWGVAGIGKTWVLNHLTEEYKYRTSRSGYSTFTLLYAFDKPISIENLVRKLASESLIELSPVLAPDAKAFLIQAKDTGSINAFVSALNQLISDFVPIILLDNTERVLPADWEKIEQQLIEPLVSSSRVLIVIAGRRQVPRWRRFEVRRRVLETEKSRIPPLKKDGIAEQLERSEYPRIPVDWLYPYTGGNPQLVDVIAQHVMKWVGDVKNVQIQQALLEKHQADLLQILRFAEDDHLGNVLPDLKKPLYAVIPLRLYRLEALRFMLTRQTPSVQEQPEVYYLSLLRRLDQDTEVVWWDRGRRAYVTDKTVRQIINRRQLLENSKDFATYHRRAFEMYWQWVEEYPQASEDFILEIWFHLSHIYLAEQNLSYLWSEARKALQFAQKLKSDRLIILLKLLEEKDGDRELLDLLPEDLRDELAHKLELLLADRTQSQV